jgi:hypothetical protein
MSTIQYSEIRSILVDTLRDLTPGDELFRSSRKDSDEGPWAALQAWRAVTDLEMLFEEGDPFANLR